MQDQKRFTILEVTADWHELMTPQRSMQPSIAHLSKQLDPRFAASTHTTASKSASLGRHLVARKLLLVSHLMEDRRLSWPENIVG